MRRGAASRRVPRCRRRGFGGAPRPRLGAGAPSRRRARREGARERRGRRSALGARLLVPLYFPESYRWPPRLVRTAAAPVRAAALTLASRDGRRPDLLIVQSLDGDVAGPGEDPAAGYRRRTPSAVDLAGTPATLTDVLLPPDGTFYDLSLVAGGRRVVFRFQGPPEEVTEDGGQHDGEGAMTADQDRRTGAAGLDGARDRPDDHRAGRPGVLLGLAGRADADGNIEGVSPSEGGWRPRPAGHVDAMMHANLGDLWECGRGACAEPAPAAGSTRHSFDRRSLEKVFLARPVRRGRLARADPRTCRRTMRSRRRPRRPAETRRAAVRRTWRTPLSERPHRRPAHGGDRQGRICRRRPRSGVRRRRRSGRWDRRRPARTRRRTSSTLRGGFSRLPAPGGSARQGPRLVRADRRSTGEAARSSVSAPLAILPRERRRAAGEEGALAPAPRGRAADVDPGDPVAPGRHVPLRLGRGPERLTQPHLPS